MKKTILLMGLCLPVVSTASIKSENVGFKTTSSQSSVEIKGSRKDLKQTKKSYVDIVLATAHLLLLLVDISLLILLSMYGGEIRDFLAMIKDLFPIVKISFPIWLQVILSMIIFIFIVKDLALTYRFYKAYKNQNKQQAPQAAAA